MDKKCSQQSKRKTNFSSRGSPWFTHWHWFLKKNALTRRFPISGSQTQCCSWVNRFEKQRKICSCCSYATIKSDFFFQSLFLLVNYRVILHLKAPKTFSNKTIWGGKINLWVNWPPPNDICLSVISGWQEDITSYFPQIEDLWGLHVSSLTHWGQSSDGLLQYEAKSEIKRVFLRQFFSRK